MQALEVIGLVQQLVALWVKISDLADILFALRLGHGTISLGDLGIVFDNLHRLEVALELEQVAHEPLRGFS